MDDENTSGTAKRFPLKKISIFIAAVIVLIFIISLSGRDDDGESVPLFSVRRGPLTISITENGTIQNREKIVITSEVEGRNTIVFLEQEGKVVNKGDLLIKLDSSTLEDNKIDQEIDVQNADASLIQARENLAIVNNQTKADIQQAKLDLKFAKIDLNKYIEGEFPMQRQTAESNIKLAEEDLKNAEDQLEWSQKLADKGYITGVELKTDELAVERKQISVETAKGEMKLLEKYTKDQQEEKLRSDVSQAEMALDRIERKAKADVVNAEAGLRAREAQYTREKNKLDKINDQIEKCIMRAPSSGMVVYAQTGSGRWRGNEEPLDVGQEVSERQELIHLPKTTRMNARIQVQESSLTKISEGMPVFVKIDAIKDVLIDGVLSKIAIMPDATRSWLNPDLKVYNCEVELNSTNANLRPGMSCSATIVIKEYHDAVYCPVQSVVRIDGKTTVYVWNDSELEPRGVEIGMDNNRMVNILGGLKEGEKVSLAPPLGGSEKSGGNARMKASTPKIDGKTGKGPDKRPSPKGRPE